MASSSRSSQRPSSSGSVSIPKMRPTATSTHPRPDPIPSTSRDPLLDTELRVGEDGDDDGDGVIRRTYERFRVLGMPEQISLEVFERLMGGDSSFSSNEAGAGVAKLSARTASRTRMASVHGSTGTSTTRGGQVAPQQQLHQQEQQLQQQRADWKTALLFLSTHLVGRQEARKARGVISNARVELERVRASHPASRLKAPSISLPLSVPGGSHPNATAKSDASLNLLADPMARVSQKRDMAYRSLDSARREWEGVSEGVRALDNRRKILTGRVAEQRRVLLLLGVLERREAVRVRRLGVGVEGAGCVGGVRTLLAELKKRSTLAMRAFEILVMSPSPPSPLEKAIIHPNPTGRRKSRDKVGRYMNTTEALAKLHAHHLSLVAHNTTTEVSDKDDNDDPREAHDSGVDARLDKVLRRLGLEGSALEKMKKNLKAVASRRAGASYSGPPFSGCVGGSKEEDELRLEALLRANEAKRAELQMKINRAVGVGWLCEEYIELISTFRNETAGDLETMLDEEKKRVMGYVDTLRESILQRREEQTPWGDDVRDALGSSRVKVWEEVRERMEATHRSEALITGAKGLALKSKEELEIGEVTLNTELMERKGRKADHGFALVQEIRTLLADSRKLR